MKKGKKGAGQAILALLVAALAFYASKGNLFTSEDVEIAEEEALSKGTNNSSIDEDDLATDEFFSSSSSTAPMEIPQGGKSHGIIINHTGFTLSYDTINHTPFWVAWELTRHEANGRTQRGDEFREDPDVPSRHAVRPYAYSNTGYTRGHMCPAGDQKWSQDAMDDCFYMSNMCPQTPELNRYWWDWLENAERQWAEEEGSVYIVCGPIYSKSHQVKSLEKDGKIKFFVGIPDQFFKVILSTKKGKEKAIGFIYDNDDSKQMLEDCVYDIDEIEEITGYDFFRNLEDKLENRLEANSDLLEWGNVPMPDWN